MRILGVDTATWTAGVGVIHGDRVLAERTCDVRATHAVLLLPLIQETLSAAGLGFGDLDGLAVSIGPGSFTGLRIGLSTVKGFALASGLPVVGVPTLAALAAAAWPRRGVVCPMLDARKGEVYAAVFRVLAESAVECLHEERVCAPDRLAEILTAPCALVGDAVELYGEAIRDRLGDGVCLVPSNEVGPRGSVVAKLGAARLRLRGADDLARLEPNYIRPSEAEISRAGGGEARGP